MFTGIVTDIGEVVAVEPRAQGLVRLKIACGYDADTIAVGASIACSGVCLTVVAHGKEGARAWFAVEAAAETLRVTMAGRWQKGTCINLERPLKLGDELGGHVVAGHADGLAKVITREDLTDMAQFTFRSPPQLSRFHCNEGVGRARRDIADRQRGCGRHLHGADHSAYAQGHDARPARCRDAVNLEIDLMARYVARLMERS